MSAPNPQRRTFKKRDGSDYIPRASKIPAPSPFQSDKERQFSTVLYAQEGYYYYLDALFENGKFDIAEYDRLLYAVTILEKFEHIHGLTELIKNPEVRWEDVNDFLDIAGVPDEPPVSHATETHPTRVEEVPDATSSNKDASMDWKSNPYYEHTEKKEKECKDNIADPSMEEINSSLEGLNVDKQTGKKYNRLRKSNFVDNEAEEAEESDNGDHDREDSESTSEKIRAQEKRKKQRTSSSKEKDDKVLALVSRLKFTPTFQKLEKDKCITSGCDKKKTPYYDDALCGTCRKNKRDKADRKRKSELKALLKQREVKAKEAYQRSVYIEEKRKVKKDLEDFEDALESESDQEGSSEEDD